MLLEAPGVGSGDAAAGSSESARGRLASGGVASCTGERGRGGVLGGEGAEGSGCTGRELSS